MPPFWPMHAGLPVLEGPTPSGRRRGCTTALAMRVHEGPCCCGSRGGNWGRGAEEGSGQSRAREGCKKGMEKLFARCTKGIGCAAGRSLGPPQDPPNHARYRMSSAKNAPSVTKLSLQAFLRQGDADGGELDSGSSVQNELRV
jgi:hypothetical protein